MPVVFSDLHLSDNNEVICFRVLELIERYAHEWDGNVIFCGDFWKIRYQVSVRLLNRVNALLDAWGKSGIALDFIPGNHDQVDINGENALEVFQKKHVRVWTQPGIQPFYDGAINYGFVPYRKRIEDQTEALVQVRDQMPKGGLIFGHFGVQGAYQNNDQIDKEGVSQKLLKKKHTLILGHYHRAQTLDRCIYVGSAFQMDFGEAGNECGCLFVERNKYEFVPINAGAPKHYVVEWDPDKEDLPPWPGTKLDRVRLDIKMIPGTVLDGALKKTLDSAGYANAQVNVVVANKKRYRRFELQRGETLVQAAQRFVSAQSKELVPSDSFRDALTAVVKQWAK